MDNDEIPSISLAQQKQELEIKLLEVEIEKAKIEKANLEKKWYQTPAWFSAILPTILGLVTIIVAWLTGFLNTQSLLNKNEATLNKIETYRTKERVDVLLATKDSFSKIIFKNVRALDSIKNITAIYKVQYESLYVRASSGSEREAYLLNQLSILHQQIGAKDQIISELNQRPFLDLTPFSSQRNRSLLLSDTGTIGNLSPLYLSNPNHLISIDSLIRQSR